MLLFVERNVVIQGKSSAPALFCVALPGVSQVGLLRNLTSPNIVKFDTCFLDDNIVWVVVEWVDGGDMRGALGRSDCEVISKFLVELGHRVQLIMFAVFTWIFARFYTFVLPVGPRIGSPVIRRRLPYRNSTTQCSSPKPTFCCLLATGGVTFRRCHYSGE